jgi:hypothetical protein
MLKVDKIKAPPGRERGASPVTPGFYIKSAKVLAGR